MNLENASLPGTAVSSAPTSIPFNKPFLTGEETRYIEQAVASGKISGDGIFTKRCHEFFEKRYGFQKALLTTSCTDALEMAAILLNIRPGDEVIVPSYTFVSTANAFALRGAKLVFADSQSDHPNINPTEFETLITPRTRAVVPVHYAGMACDMNAIMAICNARGISVVEDAAQAIDSYYVTPDGSRKPLGGIGVMGAFSFHETKNVISGEGGMLSINDTSFISRAEIIREKGTNRSAFFRGEVDKYNWVDIGSSFLPSEIIAAFLFAQLEQLENIQARRCELWNTYQMLLQPLEDAGHLHLPVIKPYQTNNAHMFYVLAEDLNARTALIQHLKNEGIHAVFHYISLHKSPFHSNQHNGHQLTNSDRFTDTLLRLPLFYALTKNNIEYICNSIRRFYGM